MDDSKKFIRKVSDEAKNKDKTSFQKLKSMFIQKPDDEEEKKRKRKEMIDRERERAYEEMKPKKY